MKDTDWCEGYTASEDRGPEDPSFLPLERFEGATETEKQRQRDRG